MLSKDFHRLSDEDKCRIAIITIAQEHGGSLMLSSGMLATVDTQDRVSFNADEEFPKICWIRANPPENGVDP